MNEFTKTIVEWYEENKRELPWRESADPYLIWISEIILQQTRVAQGYDYFLRFINRFRKLVHILIPNVLSNIYLVYPTQKTQKSNSFSSKKTLCHYFFRKMCRIYFFRSLKSYIFAVQKISNNIVIIFFLRKND